MPPKTPFTDHVTPVLVDPVTIAPNGWAVDTWTEAVAGETETDTAAVIVTLAEALLVDRRSWSQ